jgi:hypothetical protein
VPKFTTNWTVIEVTILEIHPTHYVIQIDPPISDRPRRISITHFKMRVTDSHAPIVEGALREVRIATSYLRLRNIDV